MTVSIPLTSFHIIAKFSKENGDEVSVNESPVCPYFKSESIAIILEPLERKYITLSVTPFELGIIELVGVKWCAWDKIYSTSYFNLKGPLLQKTQDQRSSRSRGNNKLLVYRIIEDMPLVNIEIENIPDKVFNGEVRFGSLILANYGRSAATSIMLKTNYPTWFCINEETHTSHNEMYRYDKIKCRFIHSMN